MIPARQAFSSIINHFGPPVCGTCLTTIDRSGSYVLLRRTVGPSTVAGPGRVRRRGQSTAAAAAAASSSSSVTLSPDSVGVATQCGRRSTNEDRTVVRVLDRLGLLFVGIFDGHGGSDAADYVVRFLPRQVAHWLRERGPDGRGYPLSVTLRKAFLEVNAGFTQMLFERQRSSNNGDTDKSPASSRLLHCGTTATICLLRLDASELTVAHVGDSRALIGTTTDTLTSARALTDDHRPDSPDERDRIVRCDGRVEPSRRPTSSGAEGRPRVNGVLEMSRSIGDVELQRYGVIAEPQVRSITLRDDQDIFLALTTDGVHNVLDVDQMSQLVAGSMDAREAAQLMVDSAVMAGSHDNCTALVVPLIAWERTRLDPSQPKVVNFNARMTQFRF